MDNSQLQYYNETIAHIAIMVRVKNSLKKDIDKKNKEIKEMLAEWLGPYGWWRLREKQINVKVYSATVKTLKRMIKRKRAELTCFYSKFFEWKLGFTEYQKNHFSDVMCRNICSYLF